MATAWPSTNRHSAEPRRSSPGLSSLPECHDAHFRRTPTAKASRARRCSAWMQSSPAERGRRRARTSRTESESLADSRPCPSASDTPTPDRNARHQESPVAVPAWLRPGGRRDPKQTCARRSARSPTLGRTRRHLDCVFAGRADGVRLARRRGDRPAGAEHTPDSAAQRDNRAAEDLDALLLSSAPSLGLRSFPQDASESTLSRPHSRRQAKRGQEDIRHAIARSKRQAGAAGALPLRPLDAVVRASSRQTPPRDDERASRSRVGSHPVRGGAGVRRRADRLLPRGVGPRLDPEGLIGPRTATTPVQRRKRFAGSSSRGDRI